METSQASEKGQKVQRTEAEWRELLTPEQFYVTRLAVVLGAGER
jgi:hypothetical protein